jgi:hypothetical protein
MTAPAMSTHAKPCLISQILVQGLSKKYQEIQPQIFGLAISSVIVLKLQCQQATNYYFQFLSAHMYTHVYVCIHVCECPETAISTHLYLQFLSVLCVHM